MNEPRFTMPDLAAFAARLLATAGMEHDKAARVAELLVQTDAMGRRTHGLALIPLYLAEIAKGSMTLSGTFNIVSDNGAAMVIDARRLPGLWIMEQAISLAADRIGQFGVVTIAIRHSHHIGSLATALKLATDRGLVAIIANSEPSAKHVAPFGGKQALFTPNPFAFGYPASEHPVLVDMSASITTVSMTRTKYALGERFEQKWLLDADGHPTDDPGVLEHTEPRGSLQLLGGKQYGHKGFGLALMVEALSQGLSGFGRADKPTQWGSSNVFLQVIDPDFFSGKDAFSRQTSFFGDECRRNPPTDPARPVRLPGDAAARSLRAAQVDGIAYAPAVWNLLVGAAKQFDIPIPACKQL